MEKDLGRVIDWSHCNGLRRNVEKTQLMVLSRKGKQSDEGRAVRVKVDGVHLVHQDRVSCPGIEIDKNPT